MNALMIGAGEYTTGYVHGAASTSDKQRGVVALVLFDLRRRGRLQALKLASTNGRKLPAIRAHLQQVIGDVYRDMHVDLETFPDDSVTQQHHAYRDALKTMSPGDLVTIFTPDHTHFAIAMDAVAHGCHVLIAKPLVKTCQEHQQLRDAAKQAGVLVAMEVHKRWDPIYMDARDRIRELGEFSFFQSYMSQPKSQLDTFRSWAGRSSDISYYLNSHHIDFHGWAVQHMARPVSVYALASHGWARQHGIPTEDTVTLCVPWQHIDSGNVGTALYSASWIAPTSDVHSQQRFFYMGHGGELSVDQAHRGYQGATDEKGFASLNPLFMKYTPDAQGSFVGQSGYGYRSIEDFVEAAIAIRSGRARAEDYSDRLASVESTLLVTAILEAGRRSLDEQRLVALRYDEGGALTGLEP